MSSKLTLNNQHLQSLFCYHMDYNFYFIYLLMMNILRKVTAAGSIWRWILSVVNIYWHLTQNHFCPEPVPNIVGGTNR